MRRPGGALLLGAAVAAAAIAFGSRSLAVVGAGLLLLALIGRGWVRLAGSEATVELVFSPQEVVDGASVRLLARVRRASSIPVGSASLDVDLGGAGRRVVTLDGHMRALHGDLDLGPLSRGVYVPSDCRLRLADHLGVASSTIPVAVQSELVVVPRTVELDTIFSDAASGGRGARVLRRLSGGSGFHSVREHEHGESLRRVHWPSSARRGQLMVKELDDAADDGVVIVLDCDPAGNVAGTSDSSFEVAVRIAGSLVVHHAVHGRSGVLVSTSGSGERARFGRARAQRGALVPLRLLAGAQADARGPLASYLERASAARTGSGELVVVTAVLAPRAVAALADVASRRPVSVVRVDAASFSGRPSVADPGALRLAAAGVRLATVRHGDDLAEVLSAGAREALRA